ncbi:hypothetical protein DFP74_4766 [Nocardiopsis sp. Huas11]|uniref:hypothetical protein n=1 Tax=Nocardiopsis sp. Huas11 TaxID=2183912 RepID=UPI000EB44764|nr:hypothetical protein [Nocardiopsis sp. Huas11]RKS09038.1 hypothetical protein DFP74_4766 [Nocardiopsis sp. Huas11]
MRHTMGTGRGHEPEVTEGDTRVPDPRPEAAGAADGDTSPRPDAEAGAGRSWDPAPGIAPEDVRERWRTAQGAFVDDPERAVREADTLAAEVCDAVVARLNARRSALRSMWENGEDGGGGGDTESLRLAMHDYRVFVENVIGGDV